MSCDESKESKSRRVSIVVTDTEDNTVSHNNRSDRKDSLSIPETNNQETPDAFREFPPRTASSSLGKMLMKASNMTLAQKSEKPEYFARLGKKENWFYDSKELELEPKPFAHGACGSVFRGKFRTLGVCVKQVSNSAKLSDVKDMLRELAVWAHIRHPYIVLFMGACYTLDTGMEIMMEDMKGGDLGSAVKNGKLSRSASIEAILCVTQAVAFLHGNKPPILHRDIKPANILFDGHGNAKLSDFGLCRLLDFDNGHYEMTGKCGTLRYMAPEVLRCEKYNEKCDVYALGLLLIFCLSKTPPFAAYNREKRENFALQKQDYKVPVHFKKQISLGCIKFAEDCGADNPTKRPSARECAKMLELLLVDSSKQCCTIS